MFVPDNFVYFISIFALAIFGGTYLLFSYYRNRLLILNALMFFLCAIRISTEYYLPQIDDFDTATNLAIFHSIETTLLSLIMWSCTYFYIRPFKAWKKEKVINQIVLWGILLLPFLIKSYYLFHRQIFYFNSEKMDGYWKSTRVEGMLSTVAFDIYDSLIFILLIILLISSIYRSPKDRIQKTLLLATYIIAPYIYFFILETRGEWNIPNVGGLYLTQTIIVSWFVSEYRLFQDSFASATNDILNSISDLIISTDLNLNITNTNKTTQSYFHLKQKGLIELMATNSTLTGNSIQNNLNDLVSGRKEQVEMTIVDKQEKQKMLMMKVAPFNKGSQQEGYTFLLSDQTAIRNKEQQLREMLATKDRLFAIISHDLRKPALAFRGISKKVNFLIKQQEFDTLNKFGENIEKAAFSLNSLLDNLLNWALSQRNVLPYQPVPLNIAQETEEIYNLFVQIADEKGVELVLNIDEDYKVFSDPNAFTTIVRNLVDNAIKYTPVGGTVEVSTQKVEEGIIVKVADTGMGIKQDLLDKLFKLSTKKSTRGTANEAGSGLGLTLVKDLVKLNKGTINVISKWNAGTTFEVLLPNADSNQNGLSLFSR